MQDRTRPSNSSKDVDITPFSAWEIVGESVEESSADDVGLTITSKPTEFLYFALSPEIQFPRGWYELDYVFEGIKGGFTIGVLSEDGQHWLASQEHQHKGEQSFQMRFGGTGSAGRIVLAGCNYPEPAVTRFRLADLRLSVRSGWRSYLYEAFHLWRARRKPTRYFTLKTICLQIFGRMIKGFVQFMPARQRQRYVVIDSTPAGYACRSIIGLVDGGEGYVITANAGDDNLSVIAVEHGRMKQASLLEFPRRSTPIHLSPLPGADDRSFLVCLFNFDESGEVRDKSHVVLVRDLREAVAKKSIESIVDETTVIFKRPGYWGFRGCCTVRDAAGRVGIAAVDRDRSELHMIDAESAGNGRYSHIRTVGLGDDSEPVGICGLSASGLSGTRLFLIGLRSKEELVCATVDRDGELAVTQRCPLKGLSRSSVVVGRFFDRDRLHVALALWGGNPHDMNSVKTGEVAIAPLEGSGRVGAFDYVPAGIHPTDVVVGDFDGDGLDELAVLNFGTGLNPHERTRTGGVQIFKGVDGRLTPVAHIPLANPRIGAAVDIDGDGVAELLVSLFFESRIASVKCV